MTERDAASARIRDIAQRILDQAAAAPVPPSLDELNERLAGEVARYNRRPQAELGGLSPERMARLLAPAWDARHPLRLRADLTAGDVAETPMLARARGLLQAALAADGLEATERGNLKRNIVADLMDRLPWEGGWAEEIRAVSKVVNEQDFHPLYTLRVLLEVGRLLNRRSGRFRVPKDARPLLEPARAGRLYHRLFVACFREMNLALLDRMPEFDAFQSTIAYSLYRVSRLDTQWHTPERLAPRLLHPVVREIVGPPSEVLDTQAWLLESRLLRPLVDFGLLERRAVPRAELPFPDHEYRRARLFEKFVRVEF